MSEVAVVGLGRLGLPFALLADRAGHAVIGADTDQQKVRLINERRHVTSEPGVQALLGAGSCRLRATPILEEAIGSADISVVCVPTPSGPAGGFNADIVLSVVTEIMKVIEKRDRRDHLLLIASTLSPGTMSRLVQPLVDGAGADRASRVCLVYIPEFHAIGTILRDLESPPMSIIGCCHETAADKAVRFLGTMRADSARNDHIVGFAEAELAKLALNTMVALRITYANLLGEICSGYPGVDAQVVAGALQDDPRVGTGAFSPGPPFGGPCFPRDLPAMRHAAKSVGVDDGLIAAAESANNAHRDWLIARIEAELEADDAVGLVGVGFKPGVEEVEGSVGLEIAARLASGRRRVLVHDLRVTAELPPGVHWSPSRVHLLENCAAILVLDNTCAEWEALVAGSLGRSRKPVLIDAWG